MQRPCVPPTTLTTLSSPHRTSLTTLSSPPLHHSKSHLSTPSDSGDPKIARDCDRPPALIMLSLLPSWMMTSRGSDSCEERTMSEDNTGDVPLSTQNCSVVVCGIITLYVVWCDSVMSSPHILCDHITLPLLSLSITVIEPGTNTESSPSILCKAEKNKDGEMCVC